MSGLLAIRLRKTLKLYSREALILGVLYDDDLPTVVIPARTSLSVLDIFTDGFYCVSPNGDKFVVSNETLREQAYVPLGALA